MQDLIHHLRAADPAAGLEPSSDLDALAAAILAPRRRSRRPVRLALAAACAGLALAVAAVATDRPGVVERAAAAFQSDSGLYHWVSTMSAGSHELRQEGWEDVPGGVSRVLGFTDGEFASETRIRRSEYGGVYREVFFPQLGHTDRRVAGHGFESFVSRMYLNFRDGSFREDGRETLDGREYARLRAERDFETVVVLVEEQTGRIVLTRVTTRYPGSREVAFTHRVHVFEVLEDTPANRERLTFRGPR